MTMDEFFRLNDEALHLFPRTEEERRPENREVGGNAGICAITAYQNIHLAVRSQFYIALRRLVPE